MLDQVFYSCTVVFVALSSAILSEVISWVLIYRTDDYKNTKKMIEKTSEELNYAKAKIVTIDKKDKHERKIKNLEEEVKKYNQKLASIRFKSMIFLSVTMISIMSILNSYYNGVVVATLPFEPISLLRGMSHRTLRGEDYTQCSMTFLYLLASAGIRGNIQKLFGHDIAAPSLYEQANEFSSKLQ